VLADNRDDLLMIRLDLACPVVLLRLIPRFVQDIVNAAILRCHLVEEAPRLVNMIVSMMVVPVDDRINPCIDGCINNFHHSAFLCVCVLQVTPMFHSHGCPHHSDLPILHQPVDHIPIPILRHPL
jgi:hypothetical protein